jgi:hypothetical protein
MLFILNVRMLLVLVGVSRIISLMEMVLLPNRNRKGDREGNVGDRKIEIKQDWET